MTNMLSHDYLIWKFIFSDCRHGLEDQNTYKHVPSKSCLLLSYLQNTLAQIRKYRTLQNLTCLIWLFFAVVYDPTKLRVIFVLCCIVWFLLFGSNTPLAS